MRIGLITARGGSIGLPRKNILPLRGRPLIAWTIEAALAAKCIDAVFVTTEDQEIAEISQRCGAQVIARPIELARADTRSEPVIAHAIETLAARGDIIAEVFLLQPTSPMRRTRHIEAAFEVFCSAKAACVISVFEPRHSPAKAYRVNDDGTITGLLSENAPYAPRQDLPRVVQPNGAIYLFTAESFMQHRQIPRNSVVPFPMTIAESVDIDTSDDLVLAETLMEGAHGLAS